LSLFIKVEFRIDTSQAQAARPLLDWNSKKAGPSSHEPYAAVLSQNHAKDDDQIETMIQILVSDVDDLEQPLASRDKTPLAQDLDIDSNGLQPHGGTIHGDTGCCKLSSAKIVDCSACLEAESLHFLSKLSTEEQELTLRILETVQTAGPKGLTMAELLVSQFPILCS
jgi:oxalate---CoA ligase